MADSNSLIDRFNSGDAGAFNDIYSLFYRELYHYASAFFAEEECRDAIQDIFLDLFERRSYNFTSLEKLKGYLFVALKNRYFAHCRHNKVVQKHIEKELQNEDAFIYKAAEAEAIHTLPEMLNMVPADCAKTVKLISEGYTMKDISKLLNKPLSTIYAQKERAVKSLQNKFKRLLSMATIIFR